MSLGKKWPFDLQKKMSLKDERPFEQNMLGCDGAFAR